MITKKGLIFLYLSAGKTNLYQKRACYVGDLMQTVKVEINNKEPASRKEILVRIVYWIPLFIVAYILSIIAGVVWIVNLLTIIILGKRILGVNRFAILSVEYCAKVSAYMILATDERPPIIPEGL